MGAIIRTLIFIAASGTLIFFTAHKLYNLPPSGVNADSGTYLFDNLFERIKLAMLSDPDAKLEKIIEFSKEKINEMKDLEDRNKSSFLEKVYEQNSDYVAEAIKQIEKIKEKGGDAADWEKKISEQILEQKEVLMVAQGAAPAEAQTIIENGIASAKKLSDAIIENASEPVKEIIVYQIKRVEAAIEDKKAEEEVIKMEEETILLTDSEKLYNIWIENLYAKTLPKADEPFFMRVYIKRRANECKFFSGELVLSVGDKIFKNQINNMMPNDDLWIEFGPVTLEKGSFDVSGKLTDNQNKLISIKDLKILVD
jgi:hypothetical protein